ncbi:MAG: hypothetical protein DHS20C12_18840 [Pseudohongiella sp.]|nr:MAG: hypothetical protein DHS20C12_18840 [Pseudohongiella sp.]
MQFKKELRERVKSGEITKSVRIWKTQRVKVGNAYRLSPGQVVVDSIHRIELADITPSLARETGFLGVADLVKTANHGQGENVYLVAFHYVA